MESFWLKIQQQSDSSGTLTLWKGAFEERGEPLQTGPVDLSALNEPGAEGVPAWQALLKQVRESEAGQTGDFDAIGGKLRAVLASSPVWSRWLTTAAGESRTYLEFVDDPQASFKLSQLPWEYLAQTSSNGISSRFFANEARRLLRVHEAVGPPPEPVRHVKVAVIVGEAIDWAKDGFPRDDVASLLREVQSRSLCAHVELIQTPSLLELQENLERIQPDVIHFTGHGEIKPNTKLPALRMSYPGDVWWWDISMIFGFFEGKRWRPRLVVLNTCDGAQAEGPFASVMNAFSLAGVSAVVAAQGRLRQSVGPLISTILYRSLVAKLPIDEALTKARKQSGDQDQGDDWQRRDWGLPVLSVSVAPERLFARPPLKEGRRDPEKIAQSCQVLKSFLETESRTSYFVGLSWPEQRWRSLSCLSKSHCIVVKGAPRGGKSRLALRSLVDAVLLGQRVRYVEVCGEESSANFIGFLNAIIDGDPRRVQAGSEVHKGLEQRWFTDYLRYRDLSPDQASIAGVERICQAFAEGLRNAAAEQELTIVLDHFARKSKFSADEFTKNLLPYLWRGIADGQIPGVRVVFVVATEEYREYQLASLNCDALLEVKDFRLADYSMLLAELCRFQSQVRAVKRAKLEEVCGLFIGGHDPWQPEKLEPMVNLIESLA